MTRNYGIPVVTNRQASGDQPPAGPHTRADTQRDTKSNVVYLPAARPSLRQPNSRAEDFSIGAGFFFLAVILLPWVIVGGLACGYLLFVS